MMTPSGGEQAPKRPHGVVRPRDEVEEHARDFLNQYYASLKRSVNDDNLGDWLLKAMTVDQSISIYSFFSFVL